MSATTQVSACVSEETKAANDAYVKRRGVRKAGPMEEALQHHRQALDGASPKLFLCAFA